MSHRDAVSRSPGGFRGDRRRPGRSGGGDGGPERGLYGVQFHPEVAHTPRGQEILKRFLYDVCGRSSHLDPTLDHRGPGGRDSGQVGDARVICGLSGGVDSSVAAALVHEAVGDQLTCIFVDHGLLRAGEAEQVEETFRGHFDIDLVHVKAADRFLERLAGVTDPERSARSSARRSSGCSRTKPPACPTRRSWCRARSIPT
jgi:GMP synthase (glutamine-hydrolysing)